MQLLLCFQSVCFLKSLCCDLWVYKASCEWDVSVFFQGRITCPARSPASALKPRWALPRVLPNKDVVSTGKTPSGSHLAPKYHPWDPKYNGAEFPRLSSSYKMCLIDTSIPDKSGIFVVDVFVVCCCCFGFLLVRDQLLFAFVLSCPKWEHNFFFRATVGLPDLSLKWSKGSHCSCI